MSRYDTYIADATPAQSKAMNEIQTLLETDYDLYQTRHNFRLQANEIVHITHRITITRESEIEYTDTDGADEEYTYTENVEEEFYYHVYFSRDGHVWFLVCDDMFPVFGRDISYRGELGEEYDWMKTGHGSRRYFFHDIIFPAVKHNFIGKIREDFRNMYVWNRAEVHVFKFDEEEFNGKYNQQK